MNIGLSQDCLQGMFASQIIQWFIRKYTSKLSVEMMFFFKTDFTCPSVPETWGNLVFENIWLPCSPFPKPFPKLEKRCQETSQQPNENVRIYIEAEIEWNWFYELGSRNPSLFEHHQLFTNDWDPICKS